MKKFRKLAAAFLAVLMLVGALPVSASADGDKLIALTFDDGPSSSNTARLLDGLKARGAHCTFFLVGQMAERSPGLVKRAWQEGHEIASHTYDHPAMTTKTDAQIRQELQKTTATIISASSRPRTRRASSGRWTHTTGKARTQTPFIASL